MSPTRADKVFDVELEVASGDEAGLRDLRAFAFSLPLDLRDLDLDLCFGLTIAREGGEIGYKRV